jgi:hypothetical protein
MAASVPAMPSRPRRITSEAHSPAVVLLPGCRAAADASHLVNTSWEEVKRGLVRIRDRGLDRGGPSR